MKPLIWFKFLRSNYFCSLFLHYLRKTLGMLYITEFGMFKLFLFVLIEITLYMIQSYSITLLTCMLPHQPYQSTRIHWILSSQCPLLSLFSCGNLDSTIRFLGSVTSLVLPDLLLCFSIFHICMKSSDICLSLFDLLHLALYPPIPSILLQMAGFHLFL